MDVLVVIDMQKSLFEVPRLNKEQVISNINTLIDAVQSAGGKLFIFSTMVMNMKAWSLFSSGWQILDEITQHPSDIYIQKLSVMHSMKQNWPMCWMH